MIIEICIQSLIINVLTPNIGEPSDKLKNNDMNKVDCALKAARETRALKIGNGVINDIASLFKTTFEGCRGVIVADTTTYAIAGERVELLLKDGGIELEPAFIFDDPNLYAEYSFIDQLVESLKKHNAIPIAIGSGTINDLTKLSSSLTGREDMCVATAASMDGYTAFGASITANGAKQTFSCPAPTAVVADIDSIRCAPSEMSASGYADLFAKITAGADWIIADALNIEPIDATAWSIVQDGLHDALSNPHGAANGDDTAIYALSEGLMLGGFAMQWSKSSRPASGAEHQFSHLWNMENHLHNGEHISHGFQVSIGMLSITALYEQLLKAPITTLDIEKCVNNWPSLESLMARCAELFGGSDILVVAQQEIAAKYVTKEQLRKYLEILCSSWNDIKKRLEQQLIPFNKVISSLKAVGAPWQPEDISVSREKLRDTFQRAQFIRRRFTVLDLCIWTGLFDECMNQLFGKGAIWEINK